MKKYLSVSLLVIIMLAIFLLSSQIGSQSHQLSNNVMNSIIIPSIEKVIKNNHNDVINVIIRKTAHILLYLALGVIVHSITNELLKLDKYKKSLITVPKNRHLNRIRHHQLRNSILSGLICLAYAFSDEVHQLFITGREASVKDVGFDAIGFIIGITIVSLLFLRKYSNKNM